MILKNLTRRTNTGQLVKYLFKHEKDKSPKPILKHNLRSRTTKGWTKEFDKNFESRIHRRKDNIRLHHTIISFSNKDKEKINAEMLKNIARKYIELRGKESLYLVSSHQDTNHIHLHIAMSATKLITGESNRISRHEFKELKLALTEYQKEKYPELVNSLPAHGKSKALQLSDPELKLQDREGKLSQKQVLLETVQTVYSRSKSLDNFLSELKSEGINSYSRGGKVYGVEDESGRHYRFKTLGFDLKKLEELDRQAQEEARQLQDLASLRDAKSQEREQDNEGFERDIEEDDKDQSDDPESDLEGETGTQDEDDLDSEDAEED